MLTFCAMNVALRSPWTVEQFLDWEEKQELRYEFDGFRPIAMTGGTFEHDAIQVNLVRSLRNRLEGKRCRVHGNSFKVHVMGSIRYPDALITCTPQRRGSTIALEPVVVFEVLSKSTAHTDRMTKNREYAGTGSIQQYFMLEQTAVEGMVFERTGDCGWIGRILGPDAILRMPEAGIEVPLAELYRNIDLSDPNPDEA